MTGLEFVQGLVDGTLPLNTIAQTLGYEITEAENGRVVITAEPNDTHLNPAGTVHGGFAATMLDSCMGLGRGPINRRSGRLRDPRRPLVTANPSAGYAPFATFTPMASDSSAG